MGSTAAVRQPVKATKSRQQPGLACEACRVKKQRCDRQEPTCGPCRDLDIVCVPNTVRAPRGPKRGHIRALQSRIQALESRIGESDNRPTLHLRDLVSEDEDQASPEVACDETMLDLDEESRHPKCSPGDTAPSHIWPQAAVCFGDTPFPNSSQSPDEADLFDTCLAELTSCWPSGMQSLDDSSAASEIGMPSSHGSSDMGSYLSNFTPAHMTDLMRADLHDLYFERVHVFAPFLNRRRYFARVAQSHGAATPQPLAFLQQAMCTLAAAMSSQFEQTQNMFYLHVRSMLEAWEMENFPNEAPSLEYVQAWILLAVYEVTQVSDRRGWMSAGRCIRLVQLMRLHEIDSPADEVAALWSGLSWVDLEERRRTFWVAYQLDRLVNIIPQIPLSLNEQTILTRLPAPESRFQCAEPTRMEFLSQLLSSNKPPVHASTFVDAILFITLADRSLSHRQQSKVEHVQAANGAADGFVQRHRWLEKAIGHRLQALASGGPVAYLDGPLDEGMQIFVEMAAHASVLLLHDALPPGLRSDDAHSNTSIPAKYGNLVAECETKATAAAAKVAALCSAKLVGYSYYKMHPFTPINLYLCARFSRRQPHHLREGDPRAGPQAQYDATMRVLRDMARVNKLAESCVWRLELDGGLGVAAPFPPGGVALSR